MRGGLTESERAAFEYAAVNVSARILVKTPLVVELEIESCNASLPGSNASRWSWWASAGAILV